MWGWSTGLTMATMLGMDKKFLPNEDYLIIKLEELAVALTMLANPDRRHLINDVVSLTQEVNMTEGPSRALMTLLTGVAYVMEDVDSGSLLDFSHGRKRSYAVSREQPSESGS